jgi:hypothetical protein
VAPTRTPTKGAVPLYPDCGFMQIGTGTSNNDGYIDAAEWANATVYDVSDTCGQSDGLPNPPGTVYLYLMQDDQCLYFGIDAVGDLYADYYDQAGLYFDDNDDGCWPASGNTTEGNVWVVDEQTGICYLSWRWWQDDNCVCPVCQDYYGTYTNLGVVYGIDVCCCGLSTQSGHVQYEVGIPFGAAATQDWDIQTYLNEGETCGFYMYYLDQYYYDFMGEMPCKGEASTYIWPCAWPSLVCVKPEFQFSMEFFQHNVPIGGTVDYAKHFVNNTCQTMTIYDTFYTYKDGKLVAKVPYGPYDLACGERLDICCALGVVKKDQFICWDLTSMVQGVAYAGGDEYPFSSNSYDFHLEPGHKSTVPCP